MTLRGASNTPARRYALVPCVHIGTSVHQQLANTEVASFGGKQQGSAPCTLVAQLRVASMTKQQRHEKRVVQLCSHVQRRDA